jgi:hypothetical protein
VSPLRRAGAALIDVIPILIVYAIAFGIAVPKKGLGVDRDVLCTQFRQHSTIGGYDTVCYGRMNGIGDAVIIISSLVVLAYAIWNWATGRA